MKSSPPATLAVGARTPRLSERTSVRVGFALVGLAIFAYTLRDFDRAAFMQLLREKGWLLALVLLPHAVGSLLHTGGFLALLRGQNVRPAWWRVHLIVLSSEAARLALPAGIVVSESVTGFGLTGSLGLRWSEALATLAVKKAWHLTAHAAWMLLLLVLGWSELAALGSGFSQQWLPHAAALAVTTTLVGSGVGTLLLLSSPRAARLTTKLSAKIPWPAVAAWAARRVSEQRSEQTLRLPGSAQLGAALFFGLQWGALVLETFIILRLLGIPILFTEALVVEMGVVMIRALAFAIPGQVGVQDAGYVGILSSLGIAGADTLALPFVLVRRAKEACFILLGFLLSTLASPAKDQPPRSEQS